MKILGGLAVAALVALLGLQPVPAQAAAIADSNEVQLAQANKPALKRAPPRRSAVRARSRASGRVDGQAVWYGARFNGRRTASGQRFSSAALTAAHASLPFGSRVRVTNVRTGRSVVVRINDRLNGRGPVVDLSLAAARQLGMVRSGRAPVRLTVLSRPVAKVKAAKAPAKKPAQKQKKRTST